MRPELRTPPSTSGCPPDKPRRRGQSHVEDGRRKKAPVELSSPDGASGWCCHVKDKCGSQQINSTLKQSNDAPPPPEKHYRRGKADAVYEYRNQEGHLLQRVCRFNILRALLGGYATTASFEVFAATRNEQHPTGLAALVGKRLVCASEVDEGQAFAEARIKMLTGGDDISARFVRKALFTFKPRFTVLSAANNRPALRNIDDAIRRRVKMLPFTNRPANPDIELESKLRKELPGILRWAMVFLTGERKTLCLRQLLKMARTMISRARTFEDNGLKRVV